MWLLDIIYSSKWMTGKKTDIDIDTGREMALWGRENWDAKVLETQDPYITILIRKIWKRCLKMKIVFKSIPRIYT